MYGSYCNIKILTWWTETQTSTYLLLSSEGNTGCSAGIKKNKEQ